jgi:hypothetical protein
VINPCAAIARSLTSGCGQIEDYWTLAAGANELFVIAGLPGDQDRHAFYF